MEIRDFDPRQGQAFQGDIAIIAMPAGISVSTVDEITPIDGRLILQEGEATGHHHAIALPTRAFRPAVDVVADPATATRSRRLRKAFGGKPAVTPTARLYRDLAAVEQMLRAGILTRVNLAIGCLVVEGGPMTVAHEEHDGIRLPTGRYYIGRQVESSGADERVVID